MPGSNSRPNVSEGYEVPTELPGSTGSYISFIGVRLSIKGGLCFIELWCVCVCVFFPFILDIKFVGRTSRGHTGGRSHRISHPPSLCGASLNFSHGKDSAISFPRRL